MILQNRCNVKKRSKCMQPDSVGKKGIQVWQAVHWWKYYAISPDFVSFVVLTSSFFLNFQFVAIYFLILNKYSLSYLNFLFVLFLKDGPQNCISLGLHKIWILLCWGPSNKSDVPPPRTWEAVRKKITFILWNNTHWLEVKFLLSSEFSVLGQLTVQNKFWN